MTVLIQHDLLFVVTYQSVINCLIVHTCTITVSLVGRGRLLPCISPQSSVTCNGEYRRPVIKAQPSFHDAEAALCMDTLCIQQTCDESALCVQQIGVAKGIKFRSR